MANWKIALTLRRLKISPVAKGKMPASARGPLLGRKWNGNLWRSFLAAADRALSVMDTVCGPVLLSWVDDGNVHVI